MSIVPNLIIDPRRATGPAESAAEEPASDATFGIALMLAVAAQTPPAAVPALAGLEAFANGEPAEGGVDAPSTGALAQTPDGWVLAKPAAAGSLGTLVANPGAVDPGTSSSAGAFEIHSEAAVPAPPVRLPAVPDPVGRGAPANPTLEPVAAPIVAVPTPGAPDGASVLVLAATAGSPGGTARPTGASVARTSAAGSSLGPVVERPSGTPAPARPATMSGTDAGAGRSSRQPVPAPRVNGGEAPAPLAEPPTSPAVALATPPAPSTLASAPSAAVAVDPLPPALLDPESTALPQTPGRVTLQFSGEGGLEGRLRVAVRGSELHATILSHPEALPGLASGLGDLRRALMDRGFPNVHLAVQPGPVADAEAAPGRRSQGGTEGRGDSRSRASDDHKPGEQRPRGRDPRRSPER